MHMHSGFPTGNLEQMIVTSWNEVTRISHAIEEGNYKRRVQPDLGTVIWVIWYYTLGLTDESQTLYSGCIGASCGAEH